MTEVAGRGFMPPLPMASKDGSDITENDIAIVGMAARLPGAPTIDRYWSNLRGGVESVVRYTREQLIEAGEAPQLIDSPNYVPAGAPLDGVEMFDGEFFGFSPKEAAILDPQHRQFLEVAWEALEDAGWPPERFDGSIGLFGGVGMGAYFAFNLLSNPELVENVGLFLLRHTGNDKDFLVTRASYLLDLRGPSVNVQTACSTSLVATHMAVQSLLSGECDMALAGGVTIEVPHRRGYVYKEGEVLSPDGHCHAFDERGQGTVFGSGAGIVVLRRAEEAIEDGDNIHAIIRGSAINNDGASKVGYLAPSVDGQAAAMAEAYELAGVTADTIDYVECHGTGTYMGDPIEVSGLTQAFRKTTDKKQFCRIGSVKTNIGHLDTAAGVASLIKAALAVQNGEMPPSLNFDKPNPNIDFKNSPFIVNDRLTQWPSRSHPRRAAVNSLGVGGTNAHIVLQQPPARARTEPSRVKEHLLFLSGRTRKAVDANARRLADHLEAHPDLDLGDVAFTLLTARRRFEQRRVLAVASREEAIHLLRENDRQRVFTHQKQGATPSCVFLMPGGGAQYPGMGADLYATEPVFAEHVDRGLAWLRQHEDVDLKPLLYPTTEQEREAAKEGLASIDRQLTAIFIVSYAMAKLLESRGVEPDVLVGHSLGQYTAACLAGVFDFEQALGLVSLRGKLMSRIEGGGVTTVEMSATELAPLLEEHGLDLAGENAPGLCIVSGPVANLQSLEDNLRSKGLEPTRVNVPIPAHSAMLDPILGEFETYLRGIELKAPTKPVMSNESGDWLKPEEATDPMYWVRHLRGTVQFARGVGRLLEGDARVFVEVGPGRILSSLVRQHPAAPNGVASIPTARHPDHAISDATWLLTSLGRMAAAGLDIELESAYADEQRQKVRLPSYAFQHARYWIEPGQGAQAVEDLSRLSRYETLDEFFHRPVWTGAPLEDPEPGESRTWLFFQDPIGASDRVIERLRSRGDTVVTVDVGDAYTRVSEHHYVLAPEQGREGYDQLVKDLIHSGLAPNRIVHMWLAAGEPRVRMGSSAFHTHTQYGFYSLLFLLQAVADEGLPTPIHLQVFTTGARQVTDEAMPFFEKSLVSGPVRVGPREIEGLSASWIDLEAPTRPTLLEVLPIDKVQRLARRPHYDTLDGMVDIISDEVLAPAESGTFAWREGQRFAQSHRKARLPERRGPAFVKNGVYLITGGLGGLGLTFARHLATNYAAKLILTGRSALPPRAEWDTWLQAKGADDRTSRRMLEVRALEQLGAEVMVAELDVTDVETLREIVERAEERWGRVHGVLHAAGVVSDELLQMKSQLSVEDVFGPKVHGTMVLEAAFEDKPLDLMVLFSSTSTVLAPAGQIDYVAANEFLNAYAEQARMKGRNVYAVNWGIWAEVGLAADALRRSLRGGEGEAPTRTPIEQPLLDAKLDIEKGASVLTTLFSPGTHWLLDQHRTKGGDAVIPGTGYLELAREAAHAFGHKRAFEIQNLFFFRPLHVADGEAKEVRVELNRDNEGYELQVRSKRKVKEQVGWELHAQAYLALGAVQGSEKLDIQSLSARCTRDSGRSAEGIPSDQSRNLAFGPRWSVLREWAYGDGEAYARLTLPDAYTEEADEFQLHPALLDIATGYAMKLIEGYDPSTLWVPVSYQKVRFHRAMPADIVSWVRNAGDNRQDKDIASFDITICDASTGEVVLEVNGFSIKRLDGTIEFAAASEPSRGEFTPERGQHRQLSPAEEQLMRNTERGIVPAEGTEALERLIGDGRRSVMIVSSMELDKLLEQQRQLAKESGDTGSAKFDRPDLDSDYVEPRDDVERTVVAFWEELLGVNKVGVQDSFFDLGGHSLIAVRLFAKIKQVFAVDYPISVLFEAPTVERCAAMIKDAIGHDSGAESSDANGVSEAKPTKSEKSGRPRYTHLVPMHKGEGGSKRPFFLVAGMFGNVLNLVHLANLLGADRPFYGLQARGLYGESQPHENFEEAARDYIAEMREVQPHGPYLLGGFSGGGLTAWEIARQLREQGEEIGMLVLLDSRLPKMPELRYQDRVRMKVQELRRSGSTYIVEWGKNRVEWELGRLRKRFFPREVEEGPTPTSFQNEAIEAAFRRALEHYEMPFYQGTAILFRPKLAPTYQLDDERWIDHEYEYMFHDNGFGKHCTDLEVYEVPGDHDSMVLEPNVRVLARRLKRLIARTELEIECAANGESPPPRDPREIELAHRVRGPKDFTRA